MLGVVEEAALKRIDHDAYLRNVHEKKFVAPKLKGRDATKTRRMTASPTPSIRMTATATSRSSRLPRGITSWRRKALLRPAGFAPPLAALGERRKR